MTNLPALPIAAPPRPAPSATTRNQDASGEIRQGQKEDGLFHEELSREMRALQDQSSPANEANGKTDIGKGEPADGGQGKDGLDKAKEDPAAADGPLAAMLANSDRIPAAAAVVMAFPAAAEAAPGAATATDGTAVSLVETLAGAANTRGARHKGPANANTAAATASADSNPDGAPRAAAGNSRTEFALAANAALAESAASGKILPAGRDALEQAAALDTGSAQRHAADASLPAGANLAGTATTQTTQTATATIAAQVAAPGWDRGLGEKVVWMAGQHLKVAELHLNPPELGPLQITLTVNNDQASAQFVSQHASVREAIEAAMPRLREMLAEGGITLGNTSVSADSFQNQTQSEQNARNHAARSAAQADTGATFRSTQPLRATRGLVDIFA